MQEHEKGVLYLLLIGAVIGIGKLLTSSEVLTPPDVSSLFLFNF